MRISSLDNMSICIKKHLLPIWANDASTPMRILDVGRGDASIRQLFDVFAPDYSVLDPTGGSFPHADGEFDVVICVQTLETSSNFWSVVEEMVRVCNDGGLLVIIASSAGPASRDTTDCYRFLPDSMAALADLTGTYLVDTWQDPKGPFHDRVGVFRTTASAASAADLPPVTSIALTDPVQNDFPPGAPPEAEGGSGSEACSDFLARVHRVLQPRFYIEIGVEYGTSLRLADCPALGIDPAPALTAPLAADHDVALMTSDDFFTFGNAAARLESLDLAYVDGLHQFEYAFKDFINIERHCHSHSVIIVDDIYPTHPLQAERQRASRFWTGDIWKIIPLLEQYRPDLILLPVDTEPTGSLVVIGLDPTNTALWDHFDEICERAILHMTEVDDDILTRSHAVDPRDPLLERVFASLRDSRLDDDATTPIASLRALIAGSLPRKVATQ